MLYESPVLTIAMASGIRAAYGMHTCEIRHSLLCGFGWESGWEMIGEPATLRSRCFAHATAKIGRTPQAYEQPSCSPCCSLPSTSVGPPVPAIETKLPSSAYPHSSCIRMQRSARQVKPLRKNMRRELRLNLQHACVDHIRHSTPAYPFSHEMRGERATAAYRPCQDSPSPDCPNTIHMPCSSAQDMVIRGKLQK